jgi:hypothetical protein
MLKFEPVEVLDVLTDVNDSNATAVSGRYVVSQQNHPIKQTFLFYPLDPNNLQIPVRGEVVLGTEFLGKYYYMSKLNIQNSPIANTKPNISSYASKPVEDFQLGKYFTENPNGSKKLITREGDTILQGRFGNSIRLGSNQSEDFFNDSQTSDFIDSPNVKIVSGISDIGNDENVYYQENLNTEINSIYLTTKEKVSFNYNNEEIDNIDEPQITIQSDNIVFHGRKEFNVYADKVVLGGNDNQPVPLGSNISDLLKDTISLLRDVITSYASANPGSSAGLTATATALENYFKEENEKFILSKKVNTE